MKVSFGTEQMVFSYAYYRVADSGRVMAFFNKLENPEWISPLHKKGFFLVIKSQKMPVLLEEFSYRDFLLLFCLLFCY